MFNSFWEIDKRHIRPELPTTVWTQEQMACIVSTIKWFRSFSNDEETSFFSESPDSDPVRLTTLGIDIAIDLLESEMLHERLWIFATASTPFYTWKLLPTGSQMGEWSNVEGFR